MINGHNSNCLSASFLVSTLTFLSWRVRFLTWHITEAQINLWRVTFTNIHFKFCLLNWWRMKYCSKYTWRVNFFDQRDRNPLPPSPLPLTTLTMVHSINITQPEEWLTDSYNNSNTHNTVIVILFMEYTIRTRIIKNVGNS